MLQSISGTPAAVLSLTFELINKIEGEMCTSKPSLADERLLGQQPSRCGPVIKAWDQEVCFLYGLRFEPCNCSYDGHWRLTWSLTSGPVGLVEVRASWPGHPC